MDKREKDFSREMMKRKIKEAVSEYKDKKGYLYVMYENSKDEQWLERMVDAYEDLRGREGFMINSKSPKLPIFLLLCSLPSIRDDKKRSQK